MKLDETTRNEAAKWFAAMRRGPMDLAERDAFDRWRADPGNQAALSGMHELWGEVSAIRELGVAAPRPASPRRRLAAAAVVLLAAVGAAAGSAVVLDRGQRVQTRVGEQRTTTLSDGSIVGLNVVTRVAYKMRPHTRDVHLDEGEAVFFVRHDAARPFLVRAGDYQIRAVGTAFDVRRRDGVVDVAVMDGVVSVRAISGPHAGEEIARLPAGRRLRLQPVSLTTSLPVAAAAPVQSIAEWRLRVVDYEDAPVSTVVEDLNRFFQRPIAVGDEALAGRRVTLRLQVDDREHTLQTLARLLGAQVRRGDGADSISTPVVS